MSPVYQIRHELNYEYSSPIFLEPQTFFLRPRTESKQKLLDYQLFIAPEPMLICDNVDVFGNNPARAWFQETTSLFSVVALSSVEVNHKNPFDYLIEGRSLSLPCSYPSALNAALLIYREPREEHESVRLFSNRIARAVENDTGRFLFTLCHEFNLHFEKILRPEGAPWTPGETLEARRGACRDLAVLFIECCRMQGLAARFVSGYFAADGEKISHELHAWCEVYLEGGGWRGYDPTNGLVVAENHIAVASAPDDYPLTPVQGSFRGNQVQSAFKTSLVIQRTRDQNLSKQEIRAAGR